jgi:hypothetical protein
MLWVAAALLRLLNVCHSSKVQRYMPELASVRGGLSIHCAWTSKMGVQDKYESFDTANPHSEFSTDFRSTEVHANSYCFSSLGLVYVVSPPLRFSRSVL